MGSVLPVGERALQPIGLLTHDGRDVVGIEQHEAQIVADVEHAKGAFGVETVEQT